MAKLTALVQMTVHEYDDGTVSISRQHMDLSTRRVVPVAVMELLQSDKMPLTHDELLLLGAAERVAQTLGYQPPLPW